MISKNQASAPVRKKRLSPLNKAKRESSRNEFVEESEMLVRVESFEEVDSSKDCPRAWLGLVKLIQNGQRKIKNLIQSRITRAKSGLARERIELDSKKKVELIE